MEFRQRRPPSEEDESPLEPSWRPVSSPPPPRVSIFQAFAMDRRYSCAFIFLAVCLIYLFVSTLTATDAQAKPTLVKAFVAFRHGSRAPGFTYNTDPYSKEDESLWPDGPGELTKAGKYEAYLLGERLRERYKNFIGVYYKPKQFKAYSTQVERTIMSAQLVLAALFPPTGFQEWNNEINWQPIPVYPDPLVNWTTSIYCPRFNAELKQNMKHNKPSGIDIDVRMLQEKTGEFDEAPFSLFAKVWDTVYFQDRANLPIPEWLKSIYPKKMTDTAVKYLKYFLAGTHVQRLLVLGPIGKGILNFLIESPVRMEIHSWHDLNIMSTLILLGVKVDFFPEPSCALSIEIHDRDGEQYFEAYYYPNSEIKTPTQLTMKCGMSCPLSELIKVSEEYLTENYNELCFSVNGGSAASYDFKMNF